MKKQKKHDSNRDNHAPVTATAQWTVRHTAPNHFSPKIDRNLLKSEEAARRFKDVLNSTTPPTWNMNYDEHVYYYRLTIMEAAQRSFARKDQRKFQQYISQETLAFIMCRRKFMKYIRKASDDGPQHPAIKRRTQNLL
eukprot:3476574-Pyramimonas_sp.AAC.1